MKIPFINYLYPLIPFPYIKGYRFTKAYKDILKTQYLPSGQLNDLINLKLISVIKYAANNVPFYKELYKGIYLQDINSTKDLVKLPIIRKEDVRKQSKKFASEDLEKKKYFVDFTSGSTGTSVNIYKFRDSVIDTLAFTWRYNEWAGIRFADRAVIITGMTFENKKDIFYFSKNKLILSSFHITKANLIIYADIIAKFKPAVIKGYPSAILLLTRSMKSTGKKPPKLKTIILTAECLYQEYRDEIRDYWGCFIQDIYGQAENVVSIGECKKGMKHLSAEFGWMEVVDENDKPVPAGKPGRLIGTGFTNPAMPLIRYDTRDIAILSDKKCSCGRNLPVVESIEGRSEDIIITPEGRMVGRLDAAFKYSSGIELSQIIQENPDSIRVKIVRGENYSSHDLDILLPELRKRLGDKIKIDFEFVENIERTSLGKLRFVISKIPVEI